MREDSSQKLQPIEGWVLSSTGIRLSRLTTSDGLAHTGLWAAGVVVVTGTFIGMSVPPVSSSVLSFKTLEILDDVEMWRCS